MSLEQDIQSLLPSVPEALKNVKRYETQGIPVVLSLGLQIYGEGFRLISHALDDQTDDKLIKLEAAFLYIALPFRLLEAAGIDVGKNYPQYGDYKPLDFTEEVKKTLHQADEITYGARLNSAYRRLPILAFIEYLDGQERIRFLERIEDEKIEAAKDPDKLFIPIIGLNCSRQRFQLLYRELQLYPSNN